MTNLGVLPLITAIQKEKKGTEKLRERQTEQHKLSKPAPSADITGSKVAINHETWLQYGELLPQLTSPPCNPINVPVMDDSAWWQFCPWPPRHTHAFTLKGYSVYTCSCVSYALGHSVADTCLLRNVRYDNTGLLLFVLQVSNILRLRSWATFSFSIRYIEQSHLRWKPSTRHGHFSLPSN